MAVICPKCGNTYEGNFCPRCGTPYNPSPIQQGNPIQSNQNPPQYSNPYPSVNYYTPPRKKQLTGGQIALIVIFGVILLIGFLVILSGLFSGPSSNNSGQPVNLPSPTIRVTPSPSPTPMSTKEQRKEFIDSCTEVVYKDVARDPNAYNGKNIKIEGKVIQVLESFGITQLRVATASNGYEDIWYVTYKPEADEKRILEDDRITVYGVCTGVESYTSVLGAQITIPAMDAKYIDIAELFEPEYSSSILLFDIHKQSYGNEYEYDAIVEIKNTGKSNLSIESVSFDIEDSTGHLLKTDDFLVYVCPDILKPGETGYLYTSYSISLDGLTDIEGLVLVPHFTIHSTHDIPIDYDVEDVSISKDTFGGVKTTGRITNNTSEDNDYLYINVIFWGKDGQILGISGTSITDLAAGKTVSFEISGFGIMGRVSIDDVDHYQIIARDP